MIIQGSWSTLGAGGGGGGGGGKGGKWVITLERCASESPKIHPFLYIQTPKKSISTVNLNSFFSDILYTPVFTKMNVIEHFYQEVNKMDKIFRL